MPITAVNVRGKDKMTYSPCSKRTAVLAIHGMGIQRPMDTVRGIVNAVWLEEDDKQTTSRRFWTHPEPSGNDRRDGRAIIAQIAAVCATSALSSEDDEAPRPWLVTDFVTLGSPLTHVHYLMCKGRTEEERKKDFERRVSEREFPVCPPFQDDSDQVSEQRPFHHGDLFGLTRWTNLYFPMSQLLWGDAVGGPLAGVDLFRDGVRDVKVSTRRNGKVERFTHTAYWNIRRGDGRLGPHIEALHDAINLDDRGRDHVGSKLRDKLS